MASAGALPGRRLDLRVKKADGEAAAAGGKSKTHVPFYRYEEKARGKEYQLAVSIKDGQYQRWP